MTVWASGERKGDGGPIKSSTRGKTGRDDAGISAIARFSKQKSGLRFRADDLAADTI